MQMDALTDAYIQFGHFFIGTFLKFPYDAFVSPIAHLIPGMEVFTVPIENFFHLVGL